MNLINEAERGKVTAAKLKALRERVTELETLLATVKEHERARIRRELLAWWNLPPGQRHETLLAAIDRIIPEPGQVEGA